MAAALDDLDRKILSELQKDAEQSLDEIARRVGSSKTPVWNRIRKMKDLGVITRTTAIGSTTSPRCSAWKRSSRPRPCRCS
jgi:Lrp/AsnC family transcriptional regulator